MTQAYKAGGAHMRNQSIEDVIPSAIQWNNDDTHCKYQLNLETIDGKLTNARRYYCDNSTAISLGKSADVYQGSSTILDNPTDENFVDTQDIVILHNLQTNTQDKILVYGAVHETPEVYTITEAQSTDNANTFETEVIANFITHVASVGAFSWTPDASFNSTCTISWDFVDTYDLDLIGVGRVGYMTQSNFDTRLKNACAQIEALRLELANITYANTNYYWGNTIEGVGTSYCTLDGAVYCSAQTTYKYLGEDTNLNAALLTCRKLYAWARWLSAVTSTANRHTDKMYSGISTQVTNLYNLSGNLFDASGYTAVATHCQGAQLLPTATYTAKTSSTSTVKNICQLKLYRDTHTFVYTAQEPTDITAVQAVNYGYNMLKDNPYTFTNTASDYSTYNLDGIIPYKGNTVCTQAKVGEELVYKLVYRYPSTKATEHITARWYVQDINGVDANKTELTTPEVVNATDITPGNEVSITTSQIPYKQFVLTCELYKKTDFTTQYNTYKTTEVYDKLAPLGTITLAFYNLTADTTEKLLKEGVTYDLTTATGMCGWLDRLCVWGVNGAENCIFISECDDPTWFPYPNNVDILDAPIIKAIPLDDTMYVFTHNSIYTYTYTSDSGSISLKATKIQSNLNISDLPDSINAMESMLTFISRNELYMIVPAGVNSARYGSMILAPVSTPVTQLFQGDKAFATARAAYLGSGITDVSDSDLNVTTDYFVDGNEFVINMQSSQALPNSTKYLTVQYRYSTKLRSWVVQAYTDCPLGTLIRPIAQLNTSNLYFLSCPHITSASTHYVAKQLTLVKSQEAPENTTWFRPTTDTGMVTLDTPVYYLDRGQLDPAVGFKKKFRQFTYDINELEHGQALRVSNAAVIDNNYAHLSHYTLPADFADQIDIEAGDTANIQYVPQDEYELDGLDEDFNNLWLKSEQDLSYLYCKNKVVRVNGLGKGTKLEPIIRIETDSQFDLANLTLIWRQMSGKR